MSADFLNGKTGKINKISYCAFSMIVDIDNANGSKTQKVVYVQKYPPAKGTTIPNLERASTPEELQTDTVQKDTFLRFWNNEADRQLNGAWKGGKWGANNLLTTDVVWCTDGFIGDTVSIAVVKNGIIKQNKGKALEGDIIAGTEGQAVSCNITILGKTYGAYLTNEIMPQVANDVLFIYSNSKNEKFIKLLKRGTGPSVDMPGRMMPGAGEHLEPGSDVKLKNGVIRAVKEEIGIPATTLANCYLLDIGIFEEEGRDPRYWMYSEMQDGVPITFGMKRGSSSHAFIIYFKSDSMSAPKEENPLDTDEVDKKWWAPFDARILEIPEKDWMIIDHKKIVERALSILPSFEAIPDEEKAAQKMSVAGGNRSRKSIRKTQKKRRSKKSKKSRRYKQQKQGKFD
jgi:8-oxo-dGTP pyrophosphatase MutT (NUDIX family)